MYLTRQIGEYLVAAKLGRMGYVATPFAGNVPTFDLLIADPRGYAVPVQVKAIRGGSWQHRADAFLEIEIINGENSVTCRHILPSTTKVAVVGITQCTAPLRQKSLSNSATIGSC
jgi:hypothetical protein